MSRFQDRWFCALLGLAGTAHAQVWSPPALLHGLVGRGDVLAAATDGGVVLWDLTSGESRCVGAHCGLPSPQVNSLALDVHDDLLVAATADGVARGWWDGPWIPAAADSSARDNDFLCSAPRPGGGAYAGGTGGVLVAWIRERAATLRLPASRAPVVAIATAPGVLLAPLADGVPPAGSLATAPVLATAPAFPAGFVAGTDGEGLWLLRSTGAWTRWVQLTARDGLPSERVHGFATDAHGRLWVATSGGLARVRSGLVVDAWPADPVLGREVLALLDGPDGALYLGLGTGVARLDPACEHPCVQRLALTASAVHTLAWADGELWWSQAGTAHALSGRTLALGCNLRLAERLGARWQLAPLWPGASVVQDPAAATETLCATRVLAREPALPHAAAARFAAAPRRFDVRGRLVSGRGPARGIYFVRVPAPDGTCEVRREVMLGGRAR